MFSSEDYTKYRHQMFLDMNPDNIDDIEVKSPTPGNIDPKALPSASKVKLEESSNSFKITEIFKSAITGLVNLLQLAVKAIKKTYEVYQNFKEEHPALVNVIKKIISVALLIIFLVYFPVYTPLVTIAIGIIFADDIHNSIKEYKKKEVNEYFNNAENNDKALLIAAQGLRDLA